MMNTMRDVGILIPKIYGYFASQSGGFDKIAFRRKAMYNKLKRNDE